MAPESIRSGAEPLASTNATTNDNPGRSGDGGAPRTTEGIGDDLISIIV